MTEQAKPAYVGESRWGGTPVILEHLKGEAFTQVKKDDDDTEIRFTLANGLVLKMYHEQDCCESVSISDICGDLSDLVDAPIVHFEERSEAGDDNDWGTSTWTFYDIQTTKGSVNIRWLGESNGYYSESVNVVVTNPEILEQQQ